MIYYLLTFAEGILTFISPCILPMLPLYFVYLAGNMDEQNPTEKSGKSRLIINSLGFVIGFTLVFITLGAAAATLGSFLENNRELLQKISGGIMVLFGLNFTGILKIGLLNSEKRFHLRISKMGFPGSILFGIVFGFGWSPCLGTFLGSALIMAGNSKTITEGIFMLLVYSLGLAIPFVVSAAIFESVNGLFTWLKKNSRVIGIISGILLIIAGILIFTGKIQYLF